MKISILGAGTIAKSLAAAVNGLEDVEAYAVASRNVGKARDFALTWGFEKAYGSYEEMLADPEVELVYVATPHPFHYEHAKMCLEAGKHVLVEKPFTVNTKQAEELISLSHEKKLFLAEAMWSRYMPSRKIVEDLIESGIIGPVTSLTANTGYPMRGKERLQDPWLAGGALLDVGVYPLHFALMLLHGEVKDVQATVVMSPRGVDWMNSVTLTFEDDSMAVLHSTMLSLTIGHGSICGEKGVIEVENIVNPKMIRVFNANQELAASYPVPEQINGYEYEVLACKRAIEQGKIECEELPHAEILRGIKLLDQIREIWGMKYPFEE